MALWEERLQQVETEVNGSIPSVFIARKMWHLLKDSSPTLDDLDGQEKHFGGREDWMLSIQTAMENADFLLVCLSTHSANKTRFIQEEIKLAVELQERVPEGKVKLIPLRLHSCEVPRSIGKKQWVNLYEPDGFNTLVGSMLTHWTQNRILGFYVNTNIVLW